MALIWYGMVCNVFVGFDLVCTEMGGVCFCLNWFVRIWAGLFGFALVDLHLVVFVRVRVGLLGFVLVLLRVDKRCLDLLWFAWV